MDLNKAKETIRKLMNLADNDAAAKGEIENAMRFANKLMEEHQLKPEDIGDIDHLTEDLNKKTFNRGKVSTTFAKIARWEYTLAWFACKLVGGVQYYFNANERIGDHGVFTLYGVDEDVEIAQNLFNECRLILTSMAALKYKSFYGGDGRSYCEGFASGLYSQLNQDKQAQLTSTTGTALAIIHARNSLIERKEELATNFLAESGTVLGKPRKHTVNPRQNHAARAAGYADGQKLKTTPAERKKKLTND